MKPILIAAAFGALFAMVAIETVRRTDPADCPRGSISANGIARCR